MNPEDQEDPVVDPEDPIDDPEDPVEDPEIPSKQTAEEACIANAVVPQTGETKFEIVIGARLEPSKSVTDRPSSSGVASVLDIDILLTSYN